jgi:hypothetical protein
MHQSSVASSGLDVLHVELSQVSNSNNSVVARLALVTTPSSRTMTLNINKPIRIFSLYVEIAFKG